MAVEEPNAAIPLRRKFEQDQEWKPKFTREEYLNAFFCHGSHGALTAVRYGRWKLHLHPTLQLYDLEKDPGERREVRSQWPTKSQRASQGPNDRAMVDSWTIKTKLRGMVIQFQREMNQ